MKIYLCPPKDKCCPSVELKGDWVFIGEKNNMCRLTKEQFEILKNKIKNNEI